MHVDYVRLFLIYLDMLIYSNLCKSRLIFRSLFPIGFIEIKSNQIKSICLITVHFIYLCLSILQAHAHPNIGSGDG